MSKKIKTLINQMNNEITAREKFIADAEAKRDKARTDLNALTKDSKTINELDNYKAYYNSVNDRKAEIEFYDLQIASKKPTEEGAEAKYKTIIAEYEAEKDNLRAILQKHFAEMEKAIEASDLIAEDAKTAINLLNKLHGTGYVPATNKFSSVMVYGRIYNICRTISNERDMLTMKKKG